LFLVDILRNYLTLVKATCDVIFVRLVYNEETIAMHFRKQGAKIGNNCLFQNRILATEPFLVEIGNHVFIGQGALLHTHDGGGWISNEEHPDLWVFGKIVIEDNCLIGVNSNVFPNVCIGKNSIVGTGSVVISDVPANSIVMGNPARVIGSSTKYKQKCFEIWENQKPRNYEKMKPQQKAKALRKHLETFFKTQDSNRQVKNSNCPK
jgi:acetyltransferase-like isoleucine patch superfamily enzyme